MSWLDRPGELPDPAARIGARRDALLAELERDEGPRTRRRPPAGVLAVLVAVVVGAVALSGVLDGTTPNALGVTRSDDEIVLRINDAQAGAERMTEELRAAGIRGRVMVAPVAAADQGSWVAVFEFPGDGSCLRQPERVRPPVPDTEAPRVRLSEIEFGRDTLRVPVSRVRESSGSFLFVAGVAAGPGERPIDTAPESLRDELTRLGAGCPE
jgi:hypothetical protein